MHVRKSPQNFHNNCAENIRSWLAKFSRLLYYFPQPTGAGEEVPEDGWIGWHNDSVYYCSAYNILVCLYSYVYIFIYSYYTY